MKKIHKRKAKQENEIVMPKGHRNPPAGGTTSKRRRGPLSNEEMNFIESNVDILSATAIADHINRNPNTVAHYIKENRLGKAFESNDPDKSESQILKDLRKKSFFSSLKMQFDATEISFFEEQWVLIVMQFGGDVLPSEELQLKELLTLEVLKNRMLVENRKTTQLRDEYHAQILREMKLEHEERDHALIQYARGEIRDSRESIEKNLRAIKDFADKSSSLQRSLNSSREQRTKDLESSRFDFISLLKALQDFDVRKRAGYEMEVGHASMKKELGRLSSYHTFSDGMIDQPVLNSETAIVEREEKEEEKQEGQE